MRRLFVLELNEVPLRVLRWHASRNPRSATAALLSNGAACESNADEALPRDLYPSQSWATLATGVPYERHGIFWYGDPKPAELPLYWQVAAEAGVSTGIFGTLHSSPLHERDRYNRLAFAVPDSFAADAATVPSRYRNLQATNLAMTTANGRAVRSAFPGAQYVRLLASLAGLGLAPSTAVALARLAAGVATGRANRERLRVGQFHLLADQFTRLARSADADLSVFFSNHIASAMHRYWYANFPEDWDEQLYPDGWVERHRDEIPFAMRSLDHWLLRWMRWCESTDRTLLLLSSMGQGGGGTVDADDHSAIAVVDPVRFAEALGIADPVEVANAMVPQITYLFRSDRAAVDAAAALASRCLEGLTLTVDRRDRAVTITYGTDGGVPEKFGVGGVMWTADELGMEQLAVEAQRVATHDPLGSVVVFNSPTVELGSNPVPTTEIAPAILVSLGIDPLPHHPTPDWRI